MMKVGCCVFLFWKKLLIIKVIIKSDCFSQNMFLKSAVKLFSDVIWIVHHEQQSIFISNKKTFNLKLKQVGGSKCKQNVRMTKTADVTWNYTKRSKS